jgi:hypothetical protein
VKPQPNLHACTGATENPLNSYVGGDELDKVLTYASEVIGAGVTDWHDLTRGYRPTGCHGSSANGSTGASTATNYPKRSPKHGRAARRPSKHCPASSGSAASAPWGVGHLIRVSNTN